MGVLIPWIHKAFTKWPKWQDKSQFIMHVIYLNISRWHTFTDITSKPFIWKIHLKDGCGQKYPHKSMCMVKLEGQQYMVWGLCHFPHTYIQCFEIGVVVRVIQPSKWCWADLFKWDFSAHKWQNSYLVIMRHLSYIYTTIRYSIS